MELAVFQIASAVDAFDFESMPEAKISNIWIKKWDLRHNLLNTHIPSPSQSFLRKLISKFFAIFRKDLNMTLPSNPIDRVIDHYAHRFGSYDADHIGHPYHGGDIIFSEWRPVFCDPVIDVRMGQDGSDHITIIALGDQNVR